MDYEKAYEQALKRAKAAIDVAADKDLVKGVASTIFPELAESEDERIIKTLQEYVKNRNWMINGPSQSKVLAWLEKQKENPKSADSIPSDCVSCAKCEDRNSKYGVFPEDVIVVARACEKLEMHGYPELAHALKNVNLYTKPVDYDHEMWKNCEANFEGGKKEVIDHPEKYGLQKEQKPAEWKPTEEQFNYLAKAIMTLDEIGDCRTAGVLSEIRNGLKCSFPDWKKSSDYPKEGCNVSLNGEIKKIQEWSEEDEKMINSIINVVCGIGSQPNGLREKQVSWLKSLRPSWKPSEEQMSLLDEAISKLRFENYGIWPALQSLKNELKKLM